jgi:hypothetical protein
MVKITPLSPLPPLSPLAGRKGGEFAWVAPFDLCEYFEKPLTPSWNTTSPITTDSPPFSPAGGKGGPGGNRGESQRRGES